VLNLLLLQDEIRVVRATGIEFRTRRYWSPELKDRIGTQIFLRFNPDDLATVYVYCAQTNEFIAEASAMGRVDSRYGVDDVMTARRGQDRQLKDLLARLKADADRVTVHGRIPRERSKRRAQRVQSTLVVAPTAADGSTEPQVETLLAQLERRLRSSDSTSEANGGHRDAC
jgi:hypothetical protein